MSLHGSPSLYCGVDIGARSIAAVIYDGRDLLHRALAPTGPRPRETAERLYAQALAAVGATSADVIRTVATGYGRNRFAAADGTASEIVCQAAGVCHLLPGVQTIVDIGGQDCKAIWVASDGRVVDFVMNDRCAAGTGRFIELAAQIICVSVEEFGEQALASHGACEVSSMCAVFAESEIVSLLQSDVAPETVLLGVCRSVAKRTVSLLSKRGVEGRLAFTGGVALNRGVASELGRELGAEVELPADPQITGALGAAVIAARGALTSE